MIDESKIHEGVWFTLPCSWDENIHRYGLKFKCGTTTYIIPSDTTNLLCRIDDTGRGFVDFTQYEERGCFSGRLKVEEVCRSGNEIEVSGDDTIELYKLEEYFGECCRPNSIVPDYDVDEFIRMSQKVFTREFRERYGLMHRDEL